MSFDATIVIASFNAAQYLPECLASAQAQHGISFEIIVVDDASTDQTASVINAYDNIHYIKLDENQGPSVARNKALALAKGKWICVLDADDIMQNNRLRKMIACAEETHSDIVLGNFFFFSDGEQNRNLQPFLDPNTDSKHIPLSLENYISHNLMAHGQKQYGFLKPLFKRRFLTENTIFYDPTLRNSEDYHIILSAYLHNAKISLSLDADYGYRDAEGSLTKSVSPAFYAKLRQADDIFYQKISKNASTSLQHLLKKRRTNLERLIETEEIMMALKTKKFGQAIQYGLKTPRVLPNVVKQLKEALMKRIVLPW